MAKLTQTHLAPSRSIFLDVLGLAWLYLYLAKSGRKLRLASNAHRGTRPPQLICTVMIMKSVEYSWRFCSAEVKGLAWLGLLREGYLVLWFWHQNRLRFVSFSSHPTSVNSRVSRLLVPLPVFDLLIHSRLSWKLAHTMSSSSMLSTATDDSDRYVLFHLSFSVFSPQSYTSTAHHPSQPPRHRLNLVMVVPCLERVHQLPAQETLVFHGRLVS